MTALRCKPPGVALVLAVLLTACVSAPTRLFMVESVAPRSAPSRYEGPAVRVAAVHIPPELDRMEIVRETAPGEFQVSDVDQWIAPLGQGVSAALTVDLAARLPQGRVIFPHLASPPGTISVSVDLLEFQAEHGGATLQASWLGSSEGIQRRSYGGTLRLQTALSGVDSASLATALSTLVAQIADQIAEQLVQASAVDGSS